MAGFTSKAIKQIRKFHGMSQQEFGETLEISASYISLIESGKVKIQEEIGNKICNLYDVKAEWLWRGDGQPFSDNVKSKQLLLQMRRPQSQKALIAASAALAPIMPVMSIGLTLGVTAEYILDKMQKAYGVPTLGDLASKKLGVDRSTLNRWMKKNNVPKDIILKASNDNSLNKEYFLINDNNFDEYINNIVDFTANQIVKYKNFKIDKDCIKDDFINCLNSNFDSLSNVDEID